MDKQTDKQTFKCAGKRKHKVLTIRFRWHWLINRQRTHILRVESPGKYRINASSNVPDNTTTGTQILQNKPIIWQLTTEKFSGQMKLLGSNKKSKLRKIRRQKITTSLPSGTLLLLESMSKEYQLEAQQTQDL